MLKELSWYIETSRFTNIVEEIEEKAEAYSEALRTDSENKEELRDDLRVLCQWHMEKSGYKTESVPYINIDMEFFNGHEINRTALNTFEKEIIKAHMYQKHLWEFMGTTGSMTVISKSAMRQDGFAYESYLPLEYKKTHKAKSPISNILKENPSAVPFYIYSDGTVSNEYNPEKSKYRLDALRDKSGFDWARKGWDPNYEVQKDGWHGEYDKTGTWTMVREGKGEYEKTRYAGARFEKLPEIEILKDGDSAILYDPNYSLISTFERIFLLTDGDIYGAEQENAEKTVSLIKEAMGEMGIKSIKTVCGGKGSPDAKRLNARLLMEEFSAEDASIKKTSSPTGQRRGKKITNERILSFYKKLFGETLQSDAEIASYKEYRTIRKELAEKAESKRIEESGRVLSEKIFVVKSSGAGGEELIRAIQTEKTKIPLSVFNSADKKEIGLTDDEFSQIQNYAVPENKKELFSRAILNLLLERKTIATGGKEIRELFDTVYADVVQGKKSGEAISVETTFSELCNNPEKSLGYESVESATIEKLREAKRNLPEQKTQELQKKVDAAVENIIRNFSAVRISTGMTPEEAVKLAARTVGGKDSSVFVPPVSGIVYQTPAQSNLARAQEGSSKRIFSDIQIADLIERAKNRPPKTKEVPIERLIAQASGGRAKKTAAPMPNLFDKEEREAWYETKNFGKTGLSVPDAERLIQSEEERIRGEISSSVENIMTFSKARELDRKMGYTAESAEQSKNALIARIEPVTQSLSVQEAAKRLEESEKAWTASAKEDNGLSKEHNVVARNLKVAEINANGRLTRDLAAAISTADFARERDLVSDGSRPAQARNNRSTGAHDSPSAREQAQSQILADIPDEIADSETSKHTEKGSGARHIAEITGGDSFAEANMEITGKSSFYEESAASKPGRIEAVRLPDSGNRSTLSGNESAYSATADGTSNNTFKESGIPHAATASKENWNAASETPPSHSSVHAGRVGGNIGRTADRDSSENHVSASRKTETMPTPEQEEEERLERMNANYEHDKAVLAKADPMFARNQFWDVGHAEGIEEEADREKIKKDTKRLERLIDSKLKEQGGIR